MAGQLALHQDNRHAPPENNDNNDDDDDDDDDDDGDDDDDHYHYSLEECICSLGGEQAARPQ